MQANVETYIKTWGIGLTGGIATGKSTVGALLRSMGFAVIDADQLAREVVAPPSVCLQRIQEVFGKNMLQPDGTLDRRVMGQLIFAKPELRKKLEAILHPAIAARLQNKVCQDLMPAPKPWFYEASLLLETNSQERFKEVWLTVCPEAIQVARLRTRNPMEETEALRIIRSQMPEEQKKKLAHVLIDTNQPLDAVKNHLFELTSDF